MSESGKDHSTRDPEKEQEPGETSLEPGQEVEVQHHDQAAPGDNKLIPPRRRLAPVPEKPEDPSP